MDEHFKIYVEQLREGHVESLSENFPPDFIDVLEKDLKFVDPVIVEGEAYLADNLLVLHIDIKTSARVPCTICNEPVKVEISIKGSYHAVPLDEIKGGVYNFQNLIRETILLETPNLAECGLGKCPQRQSLKEYLKESNNAMKTSSGEEGYRPFADLDIEEIL